MNRVFLTGFMGSGKTSVGRLLAEMLGWGFFDLDTAVEQAAGRGVPDIFREEGEEGFRRREREALLAARTLPGVHSLGGGSLLEKGAREALRGHGAVVYLRARPATLALRLAHGAGRRPLLAGTGPIEEKVSALLAAREEAYLDADWVIETDSLSPREVAREIAVRVRAAGDAGEGGGR